MSSQTMDFFGRQESAQRKTALFVALFFIASVLIVLAVYAAFVLAFFREDWWQPEILAWVSLCAVTLIGIGSAFKIAQLKSGGGASVAEMLGGRPVPPDTRNPAERRLLNVVEEMALASGTPPPRVYILDKEEGINAFAAGFSGADAVVAATRGCCELLSRDELQGVIAHEFSHILHGDMRLNIRLMGALHGILLLGIIGGLVFRGAARVSGGRRSGKGKNDGAAIIFAIMIFGLLVSVIGYIGVFFGRLIKSAAARQREFLADAAAVQFTRNPGGIAGALKKIGGFSAGSRLASPAAEQASHMLFSQGQRSFFSSLMSTHPPLEERIRRIDPAFDGTFDEIDAAGERAKISEEHPAASGFSAASGVAARRVLRVTPDSVVGNIGRIEPGALAAAHELFERIPEKLLAAAHSPSGARAVVFGLLASPDENIREKQFAALDLPDKTDAELLAGILRDMDGLPEELRLPLLDTAVQSLRSISRDQYLGLVRNVKTLIEADERVSLFEYAVQRMLEKRLAPFFEKTHAPGVRYHNAGEIARPAAVLLSTLAYYGNEAAAGVEAAFAAGMSEFKFSAPQAILPAEECGLKNTDEALDALAQASPALKKLVVKACAACIAADGNTTIKEAELFRAVADALDCPAPPLFAAMAAA